MKVHFHLKMAIYLVLLSLIWIVQGVTGKCSDCSLGFGINIKIGEESTISASKRLEGYNFSTEQVSDIVTCFETCLANCKCTSANFKNTSENNALCELNYETKTSKPGALSSITGYYYVDIKAYRSKTQEEKCASKTCENGCCDLTPCQNKGQCHELCEDIHRFNCTCTRLFEGRFCEKLQCNRKKNFMKDGQNISVCIPDKAAVSCKEWLKDNFKKSGVYPIDPDGNGEFNVWCDMDDGGYTVIQRNHINAFENFVRTWEEYKVGFGNLSAVFWLGNEKIYRITNAQNTTLKVSVTYQNNVGVANYQMFYVENEQNGYRLHASGYSGDAGDSINHATSDWAANGRKFTTSDVDNDERPDGNCGEDGGWWYNYCSASVLNAANSRWFTFQGYGKDIHSSVMKVMGQM